MRKKVVKLKILSSMVFITLLCGISVLVSSIFAYSDKVRSVIYERIDNGRNSIQFEFSFIKEKARIAVFDFSQRPAFIEAIISEDVDTLMTMSAFIKQVESFDFGMITDSEGNVLLRTHDFENSEGNVSTQSQILRVLTSGLPDTSITRGDEESLRISASAPVFDDENNLVGTVTYGRNLDNPALIRTLKEYTKCEITIFDGKEYLSSTISFPALSFLSAAESKDIVDTVLTGGEIYTGELNFLNLALRTRIYPLLGMDEEIIGMLLVGIPTSVATSELFSFILIGSIVTLVVFIIAIFISFYISNDIEKRFKTMLEDMSHRDRLLESVNKASAILLEIDEADDIRAPMISGMEHIGKAMNVDHVHLWQIRTDDNDESQFVREYSWVSDYAKNRAKAPKYLATPKDANKLEWMQKFLNGEYIGGVVLNMPDSYKDLLKPLSTKSIMMIPLFLENQFWGMFSMDNISKEIVFSDDEVTILQSISLMMANIVRRHALQNENLKVYFDALTGIHNRRYFDKTMRRLISSLSRAGGTLSLMMIDVDYFKKYNDTYGHGMGDDCLIKVAEVLSNSVMRADDFVARYGGEEFVAVMPNTDKVGALAVAEKMLENIREAKIEHKASEVESFVTFSIGLTSGVVTQFHTSDSFVQKADEMLYKSKGDGRNRYTFDDIT